jgi:hypothetical protein
MEFIYNTIASLHASWYTMAFFTVLPMVVAVNRQLSLAYLVVYAMTGAWLVMCGLPERRVRSEPCQLASKFDDDRVLLFKAIKLRDS